MIAYERKTIGELVAEAPLRANVFAKRRIDYCGNGRRTLEQVCAEKGIPVDELLAELEEQTSPDDATDWRSRSLTELTTDIVERRHEYLRSTLPSIALKMEKVVAVHGGAHPFLAETQTVFQGPFEELAAHMAKEEMILFPHVVAMEAAQRNGAPPAEGVSTFLCKRHSHLSSMQARRGRLARAGANRGGLLSDSGPTPSA